MIRAARFTATAEEIVVAMFLDSAVQADADLERDAVGRCRVGEHLLHFDGRVDGVARIAEDGVHAIAHHLHDTAAVAVHRRANERIVTRQRTLHPLGLPLP